MSKPNCLKKVDSLKKLDVGITHRGKGFAVGKDYDGFHHYWYVKKGKKEIGEPFMNQKDAINFAKRYMRENDIC
jgi:hypothetical protein